MKILKTSYLALILCSLASIISCNNDDDVTIEDSEDEIVENTITEEEKYATSGNIFISANFVDGLRDGSFYGYEEEEDALTTVDFTQYSSFSDLVVRGAYKNYIFSREVDGGLNSINKYQINKATGLLEETGSILSLPSSLLTVTVVNDELGFFTVFEDRSLFVFNPTTMELINTIDVSSGQFFEENTLNNYADIIYRAQDNKVFLPLSTSGAVGSITLYDATSVFVEVIDLNTNSWEKTIKKENAKAPGARTFIQSNFVDENGNVYIPCQGSYGLDLGGNAVGSRPQVLKIPVGSTDFDSDYSFNPVSVNDPTLAFKFGQLFTGFNYSANGIAYAAISTEADSARFLELLGLFSTGSASAAEQLELFSLITDDATARWVRLDLENQTVSIIADMPLTAHFNFPKSFKRNNGSFYFPVTGGGANSFYSHNPETNVSELILNGTDTSVVSDLIELSE